MTITAKTKKIIYSCLVIALLIASASLVITCSLFDSESQISSLETNWRLISTKGKWTVSENQFSQLDVPLCIKNLTKLDINENDNSYAVGITFNTSNEVGPFEMEWTDSENGRFAVEQYDSVKKDYVSLELSIHFWLQKSETKESYQATLSDNNGNKIYLIQSK